uniref:Thioesterase domain-containing protein n=1 Tax=Oryza brachyantha TaxID=4533 RepID=J3MKL8_ORYBR
MTFVFLPRRPEQRAADEARRRCRRRGGGGEERRKPSPAESREWTQRFFRGLGVDAPLPAAADRSDAYSALVRGVLSSATVSAAGPPRVSCTLTISHAAINAYNTIHGGMVMGVAEAVGMACARAAVGDKEMFLGELSTAYLSAARLNIIKCIVNPKFVVHVVCFPSWGIGGRIDYGELAYLIESEMEVEAQILRKGRSVVVTTVEFRLKETKKLCYLSRATFYIMPVSSL